MAHVLGVGLQLGLVVPLTLAAVDTANGERLSAGHGFAYAGLGTTLGLVGVVMIARSSNYDDSIGWLSGTLTPTLLGLGGLGFGSLSGDRPRDAWIGAVTLVSAFDITHAALVWAGRGGSTSAIEASAIFSLLAVGGGVVLAATADDTTEAALLYSLSGLTTAATVSQFVLAQRQWSASNLTPRRSPWVVAPSLTANSQMLTLQGTF